MAKCSRNACHEDATFGRDDGLCYSCRSSANESVKRKARYHKERGICGHCKRDIPKARLRGGVCGTCRNKRNALAATNVGTKMAPLCSVSDCPHPMELDGRTCLAHRPVFEKIVVSRRPSALDYVWQSRDPLEGCSDGE